MTNETAQPEQAAVVGESECSALLACPCGKIPPGFELQYSGHGMMFATATPGCCGEWVIEFPTKGHALISEEARKLAIDVWNAAPRAS
ncbi:MAG: hypothetical protein OQL08_08985 [Gammaproteobacteria bacterium]|nr:hypothetical protein [Gammaproteobacteria bacterium]